jgi:hypothetical protein
LTHGSSSANSKSNFRIGSKNGFLLLDLFWWIGGGDDDRLDVGFVLLSFFYEGG